MNNYYSDSDNESYCSYENESEYEYEEEQEPDEFPLEDEYDEYDYQEITKKEIPKELPKPVFCPVPVINPWTKKENNVEMINDAPKKSFLEIMKEEEIQKKKEEEEEKRRLYIAQKYRSKSNKKTNERRPHYRSSNGTNNKPAQSLLLSHKFNQKKGLKE